MDFHPPLTTADRWVFGLFGAAFVAFLITMGMRYAQLQHMGIPLWPVRPVVPPIPLSQQVGFAVAGAAFVLAAVVFLAHYRGQPTRAS